MSFISVFDVIGPNMVGPSSSHTAGACAIAHLAQKMLNGILKEVEFTLYGSFAKTYGGHGTDRALLGGIMGFDTDDVRIRDSFEIARERGIAYRFLTDEKETDVHPNTVDIRMCNESGTQMSVRGESLGGGKVRIVRINQVKVDFTVLHSICRNSVLMNVFGLGRLTPIFLKSPISTGRLHLPVCNGHSSVWLLT